MNITKRIKQNFFNEEKKLYPKSVAPINVQYAGKYGYVKNSPLRSDVRFKASVDESPRDKMINRYINKLQNS